MILSLLLYIFLAYMLYRLVFGLIVPIVRTTRQVKKGFRHMQEQMAAHQGTGDPGRPYNQQKASVHSTARGDDEDYIEFEEVK